MPIFTSVIIPGSGNGTIVNQQVDTAHPLGRGMAAETWGYYINSPFFQLTEGFSSMKASVVARYPNTGVNASGWLRGEDLIAVMHERLYGLG